MKRGPISVLFAALLVAAAWWIWTSASPESGPKASHFGAGGQADGFMSGEGYRWFMLFFAVLLPFLVAWAVGGLPRLVPNLTNIPNREYWLAPQRQDETFDFMAIQGVWMGVLMTLFACAIHWLVLKANQERPPRLDLELFWIVLAGFFLATGLWCVVLLRRFRKPPEA